VPIDDSGKRRAYPGSPHAVVRHAARGAPVDHTAARLAKHFGGDAASWLALQAQYDLKTLPTRREIDKRVLPRERETAWLNHSKPVESPKSFS